MQSYIESFSCWPGLKTSFLQGVSLLLAQRIHFRLASGGHQGGTGCALCWHNGHSAVTSLSLAGAVAPFIRFCTGTRWKCQVDLYLNPPRKINTSKSCSAASSTGFILPCSIHYMWMLFTPSLSAQLQTRIARASRREKRERERERRDSLNCS